MFASGSPFDPYTLPNGKTLVPGQGNNAYVFPGVALGIILFGIRHVSDSVFLESAKVSSNSLGVLPLYIIIHRVDIDYIRNKIDDQ